MGADKTETKTARPSGRAAVSEALEMAAATLITERGTSFSVRDAAALAGVNQGLIYRHFGSKEDLIAATAKRITSDLAKALTGGASPVDIAIDKFSETATLLARLILDGAAGTIVDHPIVEAMAASAEEAPGDGPSPQTRTAIAGSALLGWILFRSYFQEAQPHEVDADTDERFRSLIDQLLTGDWQGWSSPRAERIIATNAASDRCHPVPNATRLAG